MTVSMFEVKLTIFVAFFSICQVQSIKFAISHVGDVNGQFEGFEKGTHNSSKAPVPCTNATEECIGGLVSITHWLFDDEGFKDVPKFNIFRLSSGNLIGGESGWLSAHSTGWSAFGRLIRVLGLNATTLGIKEFGAGLQQTISYVKAAGNSSFSLANTCHGSYTDEEYDFCVDLNNSTFPTVTRLVVKNSEVEVNGYTVGVVGFVTPLVEQLSLPGKLKFLEIVDKIKDVVTHKNNSDIKTFIAIGDGNLETAKSILDKVTQVKLVIYGSGFSNTKNMNDVYPLPYKHGFIATAGRYGASVGKLVLDVDTTTGSVSVISGNLTETISLTNITLSSPAMNMASQINQNWRLRIMSQSENNIGFTRVHLEGGEECWRKECPLGNLMTDAAVQCVVKKFRNPFRSPLQSIWHAGAFFVDSVARPNNISQFDVHKWLPYHNDIHFVKVTGSNLLRLFEVSATGLDPEKAKVEDWGQFLQVSRGLQVHYDTKSDVPKVIRVRIQHDDDGTTYLRDMRSDKEYYLAIPTYLYEGRGVYGFARSIWMDTEFDNVTTADGLNDDSCLTTHITYLNQVSIGNEERIRLDPENVSVDGGLVLAGNFYMLLCSLITLKYVIMKIVFLD